MPAVHATTPLMRRFYSRTHSHHKYHAQGRINEGWIEIEWAILNGKRQSVSHTAVCVYIFIRTTLIFYRILPVSWLCVCAKDRYSLMSVCFFIRKISIGFPPRWRAVYIPWALTSSKTLRLQWDFNFTWPFRKLRAFRLGCGSLKLIWDFKVAILCSKSICGFLRWCTFVFTLAPTRYHSISK